MFFQAEIEQLLRRINPQSVLCLGESCTLLLHGRKETGCQVTSLKTTEWQTIDHMGKFDLALVLDGFETLDQESATHLLARLRDLHGGRFALLLNMTRQQGAHWQHADLLAFGLRLLAHYSEGADSYHLYYFDLYDYKTIPDWLNSRFWANPERWDKDAW